MSRIDGTDVPCRRCCSDASSRAGTTLMRYASFRWTTSSPPCAASPWISSLERHAAPRLRLQEGTHEHRRRSFSLPRPQDPGL